jgi:hypothetical protein
MYGFIGSHYPELAAGVTALFLVVLGIASVEDAVKRRRS